MAVFRREQLRDVSDGENTATQRMDPDAISNLTLLALAPTERPDFYPGPHQESASADARLVSTCDLMSKDPEHKLEELKPEDSGPEIFVSAVGGSDPKHADGLVPLNGERFGKYLLVGEIARGGMGEVFLAVQQGLEGFSKVVVIKRVVSHLTTNSDFVRMFIDEARLAARLEHPNIVKTYEFGDHEGQYYTVMEFLAGEDLRKVLNRLNMTAQKRLSLPLAIHIVMQICNGLHFAHELTDHAGTSLKLVHRDINPANVIVTYTGEVKIIDFGVAKVNTTAKKTLTGVIKGKIAYMSPEHILARGVDRRSDIFSTGIVLWELLMGRPLFARDCDASTMYAVMNEPIPRPSEERADVPPQLDAIVARALARTPGERFETVEDLRAALDELAANMPKVDGRSVSRMMEELFGPVRAQAKRSISQSRSLAHNIGLVMKAAAPTPIPSAGNAALLGGFPTTAIPTVVLRGSPSTVRRNRRRQLVIGGVAAGVLGMAAVVGFGLWAVASVRQSSASLPPRTELPFERAVASSVAMVTPTRVEPPPDVVAESPEQGSLSLETRPNALVFLDGEPIEQGSFFKRRTPSGHHEIMVKLPGYVPIKRSLSIVANRETRLELEPTRRLPGTAPSQSTPDRADRAALVASRAASPPVSKDPGTDPVFGSSMGSEPPRKSPAPSHESPPPAESRSEFAKAEPPAAPIAKPAVAPSVKSPSLDVTATRVAVRSQIAPLQQCYERAKMDDSNLKGGVVARITVAADGSVANVQLSSSTLSSPQVEGCISREIVRWHLPRPSGGVAVSFSYPFVFE